jgi:hypothetical protein
MNERARCRIEEALTDAEREVLALWCRRLRIPADQWPSISDPLTKQIEHQAWLALSETLEFEYGVSARLAAADELGLDFQNEMRNRRRYVERTELSDARNGDR